MGAHSTEMGNKLYNCCLNGGRLKMAVTEYFMLQGYLTIGPKADTGFT